MNIGYIGEHKATKLIIALSPDLKGMTAYKIEFSVCGKVLASNTVTATNNVINYAIPQDITLMPIVGSVMGIQVIGNNGENIIKSPIVEAYIGSSLQDSTAVAGDTSPSVTTQIEQLMAAKHTHGNKSVLDKFAESDGKPTYDGKALGGGSTGSELFIVNVQAKSGADEFTITSHDKTYAQIDEAYKAGKQILAVFTINEDTAYLLPLVFAGQSNYTFGVFAGTVFTIGVGNTDSWHCSIAALDADSIEARPSADASSPLEPLQNILDYKVYPAVDKSHEHTNKDILDSIITTPVSTVNGQNGNVKSAWYVTVDDSVSGDMVADKTPTEIEAAVNNGYAVYCNITIGGLPSTLPLFVHNNTISVFSGSGGAAQASFSTQYLTTVITNNGVYVEKEFLAKKDDIPTRMSALMNDAGYAKESNIPTALKNPYALTVNVDGVNTNYDGSAEKIVAVKGATKQITTGSNITLSDNTEYRLIDVSTLTLTYPTGDFECWMRLNFAASGNITVTLPADTKYIGTAPDFKNGETWELSFKDKILAAQKVGEGT